jgi:hypothetical protein
MLFFKLNLVISKLTAYLCYLNETSHLARYLICCYLK